MKEVNVFFSKLRHDGGAIWLENDAIKLSTSKKFQNEKTKKFILRKKDKIIAVLNEHTIFSRERFLDALILDHSTSAGFLLSPAQARLVNLYQTDYYPDLHDLIFIHPGHGGAEVYQGMADALSPLFNCVGIENYNILHDEKITSLNELATHYLVAYEEKFDLSEPVNLIGWSLGGLIALEMAAILESLGFEDINVILLDTFIWGDDVKALVTEEDQQAFISQVRERMSRKYEPAYIEKVASAIVAEWDIAYTTISYYLEHTSVILFKATGEDEMGSNGRLRKKRPVNPLNRLKANNIDEVAANVVVIKVPCDHYKMLDSHGGEISDWLLNVYS